MDLSPQLGRGFRALKLWWVVRTFGREGLTSRLDHAIELADWLREKAASHPDWHCPAPSLYPLVCLRYEPVRVMSDPEMTDERRKEILDALNARILTVINESGTAFVSHSVIREGFVIRVSIGNIHTVGADIEKLWDLLTDTAEKQLGTVTV